MNNTFGFAATADEAVKQANRVNTIRICISQVMVRPRVTVVVLVHYILHYCHAEYCV